MLVAELFQLAIFNLHPVWMGGHSLAEWRTRNPHWTRFPTAKRRGRGTRTCPELWWSRRTRETSRALRRPWSGAWSRPRGSATGRRFRATEGWTWWPGKNGQSRVRILSWKLAEGFLSNDLSGSDNFYLEWEGEVAYIVHKIDDFSNQTLIVMKQLQWAPCADGNTRYFWKVSFLSNDSTI